MARQSNNIKASQANTESLTDEKAMNIVLDAERNARASVEKCREEADASLQQARLKAQRIGKRVDDRISRIHQRVSRVIADQVRELDEQQRMQAKQEHLYRIEKDVVQMVVERIAEMMTTPDEEDGRHD